MINPTVKKDNADTACPWCNGTGHVFNDFAQRFEHKTCKYCKGTGIAKFTYDGR